MILEYGQKGSGNVSSMMDVGNSVSNDVVGSGYVSNLEAHPISQEEGTMDATIRARPPKESLHPLRDHDSPVLLLDSIQTTG